MRRTAAEMTTPERKLASLHVPDEWCANDDGEHDILGATWQDLTDALSSGERVITAQQMRAALRPQIETYRSAWNEHVNDAFDPEDRAAVRCPRWTTGERDQIAATITDLWLDATWSADHADDPQGAN